MEPTRAIPARTVPEDKPILQEVRRFIRAKTRKGWSLDQVQTALQKKYDRDFGWFMQSWADHHSEGVVVKHTEMYRGRISKAECKADADTNWRVR